MISYNVMHQEQYSRGELLLRTFFGWLYCLIPHGFLLFFRAIASAAIIFVAWWVVLFTGRYPVNMFEFVVGPSRWNYRISAYMMFMSDTYPPFSGKP